jgi:predicted metal-dependent phosphoesterase TrpH
VICADLHVHTNYSSDATINPKTIADQLNAHPTIKAVAITDHNTTQGYHKVRELTAPYKDTLIIPAVEISATGGDIIILGTTELPPKPWTIKNVTTFAKQKQALTIVAHPYRAYGLGDTAKNHEFDAIETLNGTSTPNANKLAQNLAKEMGLPGVAGSDAHQPHELWSVYTEINVSLDLYKILEAIKKGNVRAISTEKSIHF